jgi:ATP-dependent DNA helicase RecQ
MAGITGVGAKKLETWGNAFLEVIAGAAAPVHPARRALAGRAAGALFDRLEAEALRLARGEDGTGKPMSLDSATLRRVAERRPRSLAALEGVQGMGPQKAERFGAAFLAVIEAGGD